MPLSGTTGTLWPVQPTWTVEAPRWPLVVDLNGDQQCEIVVPDGSSGTIGRGGRGSSAEIPWGAVAVLAGATGEQLWTRRLASLDQQVDHFVAGPDLDQDGYREVFTFSLAGYKFQAHLDALSGQKGDTLWTNSVAPPPNRNTSVDYYLVTPQWWQAGSDGWPQLIGQMVEDGVGSRRTLVGVFSAGTGRVSQLGHNITAVRPADIDGDGTQDLLVYDSRSPSALDQGGTLHCVRGVAKERWALLGDAGNPTADFDGDGTLDLLSGYPSETLTATSGATGATLWRSRISEEGRQFEVRAAASHPGQLADLDGDGTDDLLGWTYVSHYRRRDVPFFAVSGKTGRKLWAAADISIQILQGVLGAEANDLDRDGKPEVLWLAALDYGYTLRGNVSSHESQLWLFVTSGQTGKLRWSHPLSSAYGSSSGNVMQARISQVVVAPAVGDINGDGINDMLVPELLPDGQSLQTVALSGKDGEVLWSRPCPADGRQQVSFANWIPPAVCDLDGDGRSEVVVVEIANSDTAGQPIRPQYRVVCLRGRDGGESWNWLSETASEYWQPLSGSKGELMRPRLLRTGGTERRVAVLLPGNAGAMVVFGPHGAVQERKANYQTSVSGIWVCDADGDGVDEVAFFDSAVLCMAPADRLDQPLWTQSLGSWGQHRILGIQSRGEKRSPVVAVARDANDNSVVGYDAASGRRVWSCPGVISRDAGDGTYLIPSQVALLDKESVSPHVYYKYNAVSRCRRALSLPALELAQEPARTTNVSSVISPAQDRGARSGVSFVRADRYSARNDDRWARDLPWVEHRSPIKELVTFVLWSLVFALLLVVIPTACLVRLVMLRRFGLRMLLTMPVVAGLFVTAWLVKTPIEGEFDRLVPRLWVGFAFSPVVVAVGLTFIWSVKRQWRRILFWFGTTVVVSGICASVFLGVAAQRNPQPPEVHYDLTGWYRIGLIGAYLTSWLLVVALPSKQLVIRALNRFRRGHRAAQPTEPPQLDPTLGIKITPSP